jgi:hypothetical protein
MTWWLALYNAVPQECTLCGRDITDGDYIRADAPGGWEVWDVCGVCLEKADVQDVDEREELS